jgi:hypothetical protein
MNVALLAAALPCWLTEDDDHTALYQWQILRTA